MERRRAAEEDAAGVDQLDGERMVADPNERGRKARDRIVPDGAGAVAARRGRDEPEVLIDLLPCLHADELVIAGRVEERLAAFVDGEGGAKRLGFSGEQILHAIEDAVGLFAAGERDLDRSLRTEAL